MTNQGKTRAERGTATNASQLRDGGATVSGVSGGEGGIGSSDTDATSEARTGLGSQTSGQVSGGGERSGAETRSAQTAASSPMSGGQPTSATGDWGNKSGSGSGGQGESDMDEPSTSGTNG